MWAAIRASRPLFVGMIFLMVSNGLLTTLLTLRGGAIGFSDSVIGLMQSGYPVGALLGCFIAPRLIMRVGHIRVFAALASIASAAALVHLITVIRGAGAPCPMVATSEAQNKYNALQRSITTAATASFHHQTLPMS